MTNGTTEYRLGEYSADIETLKADIREIKQKVDELNVWRWKTIGAMGMIAFLVSLATSFLISKT
mgnify:CR=1 FL=1